MNESSFSRRQLLAGAGAMAMGPLTGMGPAAAFDWQPLSLREAGFADDLAARLDKAIADKRIWNLHSVVIVRKGRLVFERYFEGMDTARGNRPVGVVSFKPDTLHDLRSASKSIVGLLYGIALAAGKVPAPEDQLMRSFPEYADLAADPARQRWTLHHVLSMTMGTDWTETGISYTNPANSETAMDNAPDRYRYVLDRPIVQEPGKRWTYNGGATALLGRLIAKGTGKSLHPFAREVLFDPLGIGPTDWYTDKDGEIAASGLRMTPRDLARIGQLMLQGGVWDGRAVVPAEWVARCTTQVVPIDDEIKYGYQWYGGAFMFETPNITRSEQRFWNASGNGGQRLTLYPGLDLIVVVTAGNYNTKDGNMPSRRVLSDVVFPSLL